jgi:hypothetical protein
MTTAIKTYELAAKQTDGWEHMGDFETFEAAVAEALRLAAIVPGPGDYIPMVAVDDFGTKTFGISDDPNSGHYEDIIEVYEDGDHAIL